MPFSTSLPKIQNKGINAQHISAVFHALILLLLLLHSRNLSHEGKDPAVFVDTPQQHVWVEVARRSGECQIFDVSVPGVVRKMTAWLGTSLDISKDLESFAYVSGQHIEVLGSISTKASIETSWMRAGTRMTLGILLHPDRMDAADWQDISGIGPVLAQKIIAWRQKNGDFGSIARLQQVQGIGPKTVASLRHWFLPSE